MRKHIHLFTTVTTLGIAFVLSSCSTPGVQETRQSGLENRQDRMDSRTRARQERWQERGEREDARANARFEAM